MAGWGRSWANHSNSVNLLAVHERHDPEANGVAAVHCARPLTLWPHGSPAQMLAGGFSVRVMAVREVSAGRSLMSRFTVAQLAGSARSMLASSLAALKFP